MKHMREQKCCFPLVVDIRSKIRPLSYCWMSSKNKNKKAQLCVSFFGGSGSDHYQPQDGLVLLASTQQKRDFRRQVVFSDWWRSMSRTCSPLSLRWSICELLSSDVLLRFPCWSFHQSPVYFSYIMLKWCNRRESTKQGSNLESITSVFILLMAPSQLISLRNQQNLN